MIGVRGGLLLPNLVIALSKLNNHMDNHRNNFKHAFCKYCDYTPSKNVPKLQTYETYKGKEIQTSTSYKEHDGQHFECLECQKNIYS